jgi:Transposase and inactivated derivatives, IS30 family
LLQDHSPEQIVGMWPASRPRVSVQAIYTYIQRERPEWLRHLRQGRARLSPSYRQPRKYQRIRNITPITERPRVINERGRGGNWESDPMRGSDRHAGSATHEDRRTGYVVLAKVMDRSATRYIQATVAAFARHALGLPMRSFAVDHGMEFAKFPELEAACGARVYFAQPYCAWQRGTNENTNGLLRQYFPKSRDFR